MNGAPSRASATGDLLVVFNADEAPLTMTIPPPPKGAEWDVVFDTAVDGPTPPRTFQGNESLHIAHRSTVLLESRAAP